MENYNAINITLDLFSAVITLMIGTYLIGRRSDTKANRYFLWLSVWNLLFILGDLSDWCCNGLECTWYPVLLHVGQFLYYSVLSPFLYTMMKYVSEYMSSYGKVPGVYMRITKVLAGLHLAGAILTPVTGLYYVISEENIYFRGKGVVLASIFPVVVYIMVIIMTFQFRKRLHLRTIIALLSYVWFPLIGQVVQNLFRGVATLNPAITLAILFIFFNIQLDRDIQYEKNKQKLTEANVKIMLSQIQPHFIYNMLAVIRGLCTTDAARAKEVINDFSLFLRANMDSLSNEQTIPFEQELNHVKSYLNLLQLMYEEGIKVEYDIAATQFRLPALSLQPLIENAVHKGLRKKEGGGIIKIHSEAADTYFKVIIEDDGVGFNPDRIEADGHIGIDNVRKRLAIMCEGSLVIDSKVGVGTRVEVIIPKKIGGNDK